MVVFNKEEYDEKVSNQEMLMNKRLEEWNSIWRWWHYTKIYIGFFFWFILPLAIIVVTFTVYPFMAVSIPSVVMVLVLLILLAVGSSNNQWRAIY